MTDLNDVVAEKEEKRPGRMRLLARAAWLRFCVFAGFYFWPVLPLMTGTDEIAEGLKDPQGAPAVVAGVSWTAVACIGFLACHALYRIKVNITMHRRPFTKKDRVFCLRAAWAALVCMSLNLIVSVVSPGSWDGRAPLGYDDVMTGQVIGLMMLSTLLFALADVHAKGSELNDELEKGV